MTAEATLRASYFDALYRSEDPFGYRSRWYEERKRQILTATLPQRTYKHGWEIGCSNGELTAALAARCERLLATDLSQRAVELAQTRNVGNPHVSVERWTHPREWPLENFDLIVLSEVGYYLSAEDLADTIEQIGDSLTADGLLVACHWLAPFDEAPFTGREVHAHIDRLLPYPMVYRYQDEDFLLEAWSTARHTLAELEGLK